MLISFSLILENLVDYLLKESKLPQVCWKNGQKGDLMNIPFVGVPSILLSTREYQCHQEKDKNISKKKKIYKKSTPKTMLRLPSTHKNEEIVSTNQKI